MVGEEPDILGCSSPLSWVLLAKERKREEKKRRKKKERKLRLGNYPIFSLFVLLFLWI